MRKLTILFLFLAPSLFAQIYPFIDDGLYGFKSDDDSVVLKPQFREHKPLKDGYYVVNKQWSKSALLNPSGKLLTSFDYWWLLPVENQNLLLAYNGNMYGLLNFNGDTVLPFEFSSLNRFDKCLGFEKGGRAGLMDYEGIVITKQVYDGIGYSDNHGLIKVEKSRKAGYINTKGEIIIPLIYGDRSSDFRDGRALVQDSSNYFSFYIIDTLGTIISDRPYSSSSWSGYNHGYICLPDSNKVYHILDYNTKSILQLSYRYVSEIRDGFVHFVDCEGNNKVHGYVDTSGNIYSSRQHQYDTVQWNIPSAPRELPDNSNLLELTKRNGYYYIYKIYHDKGVDTLSEQDFQNLIQKNQKRYELIEDDCKEENFDEEVWYYGSEDQWYYQNSELEDFTYGSGDWDDWDTKNRTKPKTLIYQKWQPKFDTVAVPIEQVLRFSLNAFCEEPQSYYRYYNLNALCIAYGLQLGKSSMVSHYSTMNVRGFEEYKKKTFFEILQSEKLRQATWDWARPMFKKAFTYLNPIVKDTYKEIARYIKDYMNNYDLEKTKTYLKYHEIDFARKNMHGELDDMRKLSAFVDRLIIIHKVISVEDARRWINTIADEVETWE